MFDWPSSILRGLERDRLSRGVAERLVLERVEAGDVHAPARRRRRITPPSPPPLRLRRSFGIAARRVEVRVAVEHERLADLPFELRAELPPAENRVDERESSSFPIDVRGPPAARPTDANVMRCGRSTAATRSSGSSHGFNGVTRSAHVRPGIRAHHHEAVREPLCPRGGSARDRRSSRCPSRCRTCRRRCRCRSASNCGY